MQDYDLELKLDEYLPLRDVVFNTLRQAILTGELKSGERLMELHLAKKLGVSRTPIREAIRMLELEGLVTMIPRKGAEVSALSKQDITDVLEVRRSLDMLAVSLCCKRHTGEDYALLEEAAEAFKKAVRDGDLTEVARADVAFHDRITASSGNRRLIQLVNNLAERMYRYRMEYIRNAENHENLIKEHDKILACIKKRDAQKAEEAIRDHVDNQMKAVILHLDEEPE